MPSGNVAPRKQDPFVREIIGKRLKIEGKLKLCFYLLENRNYSLIL